MAQSPKTGKLVRDAQRFGARKQPLEVEAEDVVARDDVRVPEQDELRKVLEQRLLVGIPYDFFGAFAGAFSLVRAVAQRQHHRLAVRGVAVAPEHARYGQALGVGVVALVKGGGAVSQVARERLNVERHDQDGRHARLGGQGHVLRLALVLELDVRVLAALFHADALGHAEPLAGDEAHRGARLVAKLQVGLGHAKLRCRHGAFVVVRLAHRILAKRGARQVAAHPRRRAGERLVQQRRHGA